MLKYGRMKFLLHRRNVVGPVLESNLVSHSEALSFGGFKEE